MKLQIPAEYMASLQAFLRQIVKPSSHIIDVYQREQAVLIAAALLIMSIPMTLFLFVSPLISSISTSVTITLFANSAAYLLLYGMSRTKYVVWAMRGAIWLAAASIVGLFMNAELLIAISALYYLAIPVVLSGFFLQTREAIVNYLILTIFVLFASMLRTDFDFDTAGVVFMVVQIGTLSTVAAYINRRYQRRAVENEMRYRSLMEANFEGIMVIDADNACILDANPAAEAITGYSRDELIGKYPVQFVEQHDKDRVRDIWQQRMKNIPIEIGVKHRSGYIGHLEVRLRPYAFRDRDSYVLTLLDITARKHAETLILESESRFRAIFNGSTHYIGVLDNTGKIIDLNEPTYDVFGLIPRDVLGRHLWEIPQWARSDSAKVRVKDAIESAIDGRSSQYEFASRDKNGNTIYLDFSMSPVTDADGNVTIIIAESRDVTEKRRAAAERRELENRYLTLFKNTTDAVFIIDRDGMITDVNRQGLDLLHTTYDHIINTSVTDYVVSDEQGQSQESLDRISRGEPLVHNRERMMKRANGETFPAETMGIAVHSDADDDLYILSMVRDISERVRREEERFTTAVHHERMEFLTHFIENASHHFRTPITNMKTRMYILPRVLDKPEKRNEQIDILNQELERLQNILNDLLTVLRLQKDDTEYSFMRVNVNQIVSEVRQSFAGRQDYSTIVWDWQLSMDDAALIADRALLAQAIVQIVDNAIEHTPEGGTIKVIAARSGLWVTINVIDTGSGIQSDDLSDIFNDFYRGQDAMAQDSTGSGLGLTIAKLTVERHDGRILVASEVGQGTHFQIILPSIDATTDSIPELPSEILALTPANS